MAVKLEAGVKGYNADMISGSQTRQSPAPLGFLAAIQSTGMNRQGTASIYLRLLFLSGHKQLKSLPVLYIPSQENGLKTKQT